MNQTASYHLRDTARGQSRSAVQRWGALIGGGALAIYGLSRRSPLGIAVAAGGGTLAYLGANNLRRREPVSWTSLLVNTTPQQAYRFWRDFENLARFMTHIEDVTVLDQRRSRWVALGPLGRRVRWDAEIIAEQENEFIAWRSLPGSDVQVEGRVEFRQAPAGRGTIISAIVRYHPPIGAASSALATFLNKSANFVLRQDLRRLEALMETGEIPTTEGQPHGPRGLMTAALRTADPTRPLHPEARLRDVLEAKRRVS